MGRHAGIQKILSERVQIWQHFFHDKGREDPCTTISGRFGGVPMMALYWMLAWQLCESSRDRTCIARKPYIFVILGGGGGSGPPVPSGSAHGRTYHIVGNLKSRLFHQWKTRTIIWLLALVCGVFCEFVTFPLVSWVRCGTWLYRFLIFAPLLTFKFTNTVTAKIYIYIF